MLAIGLDFYKYIAPFLLFFNLSIKFREESYPAKNPCYLCNRYP